MKSRIAVIGAAGKMGAGIGELLMHQLFFTFPDFHLVLIDSDEKALFELKSHFRKQLRTFAEKNINQLRDFYKKDPFLISNQEMIDAFMTTLFDHVTFSKHLEDAKESDWIFEAIVENVETKVQLFNHLRRIVSNETLFFSNTSAIPIKELGERVLGFHFYNPPTHNKCLEIVASDPYKTTAETLAKTLKKTYVLAGDVPGFIGNGHFIRELKFALNWGLPPEKIDEIYEKDLLRPFGPFKLAAFIGIATVVAIGKIMGMDCSGIFKMDLKSLKPHKAEPQAKPNLESEFALPLLQNSKRIAEHLVEIGAAPDLQSVETVLKVGFQHPYGFEYV